MRAALDALVALRGPDGRTIAVLGEMAELGPSGPEEHEELGRHAARLGVDWVLAVGEPARPIQRGAALEGSTDGTPGWVPDAPAAVALLRRELRSGDVVLVKASRAASLERVAQAIAAAAPQDGEGGGRTP
jgi:UDP-N-acetylmuramoyl-tripeptide--D-alanyl-D-alanine ligase